MKRKNFLSALLALVFSFCIGSSPALATELSSNTASSNDAQAIEFSVSKTGDVCATLNPEQLEEGIPFEETFTMWVDANGDFYSDYSSIPSSKLIPLPQRLKFTYSGNLSKYRISDQTWKVTCTAPLIKYVSGDVEYVLNGDIAGDDFLHSDPLAGFSIVHGDMYDFVFPSSYQNPDSVSTDILWHVSVIDGFPSSEIYDDHSYVLK